jgi:hypothetical protein
MTGTCYEYLTLIISVGERNRMTEKLSKLGRNYGNMITKYTVRS